MRGARLRGQSAVEFALGGLVVILLIIAVMSVAVTSWQRSAIDYELSSLSDSLPAGWASMGDEELLRHLVLSGSTLDPERLEISRAVVEQREEVEVRPADEVAQRVGSSTATVTEKWVEIEGTVSYELPGAFGSSTYIRDLEGTYLIERRYEIS